MTVYTRSRGSGSGSHVICSRRPFPPPKASLCARSSIDMPMSALLQDLGFVAQQRADGTIPIGGRRVLAQVRLQGPPVLGGKFDRLAAGGEDVVGELAHALERRGLVAGL